MGKIKDINSIPTWQSKSFGVEIEFIHKPEGQHRLSNRAIAQADAALYGGIGQVVGTVATAGLGAIGGGK